ncbi:putative uncharacterized protein precursor [Sphingomonas paucimobilis]|nr:putative uncharacterized protein precursor [Sphingomonas paucimobilis]
MRYSALALAAAALSPLPASQFPHEKGPSPYFCGNAPPGWVPPWQRGPEEPSDKHAACHLILCGRKKAQAEPGEDSDGPC